MNIAFKAFFTPFLLVIVFLMASLASAQTNLPLSLIDLPEGFKIELYAEVPEARSLTVGALDTTFVGSRRADVYAVIDRDQDAYVDDVVRFAAGLNSPNGVAIADDGTLYIAENTRVIAYPNAEFDPMGNNEATVIYDALPAYGWHGWRYLALGPDDKLYVAMGAPCNICELEDPFGTIVRLNRDGSEFEVYARGIRNSVGIDFHPITNDMYFTNNGADELGDDLPADTVLRADKAGLYYGFPYVASSGDDTPSPDFVGQEPPEDIVPAVAKIQAHSAPLGIHFYQGDMFPESYRNVAFVAEHGSWNRSEPVGYQVSMFVFSDDGELLSQSVFALGWLQDGQAWGRPVDIAELSDGSLLVSDDAAGAIYRISYEAP